jgi:hypothetical protein
MRPAKTKSILGKFKPIWDHGKLLINDNPKIGYLIKNFVITQIHFAFKNDPNVLGEKDKDDFAKMIQELKNEKKNISPEDQNCAKEEFYEFLDNLFTKVDDEDRNGDVTMKTSAMFKMLGDLVEVVSQFEPIPEVIKKKRKIIFKNEFLEKYCKFKALDIFKALKNGEVPKRGGPKEEEDDLTKEVNAMALEGDKNISQPSKIDGKKIILKIFLVPPTDNIISPNRINNEKTDPQINPNFNININNDNNNNVPKNYTPPQKFIPSIHQNIIPNNKQNIGENNYHYDINRISKSPQKDVQSDVKNVNLNLYPPGDLTQNINSNINSNSNRSPSPLPSSNLNLKPKTQHLHHKSSILSPDYKIDTKFAKVSFDLPVKYKDVDYFRLIEAIKKQIDIARGEMKSNKIDKAHSHMELVLYYLNNVEK